MDLDKILTIGVTSHNSNVNPELLSILKSLQNIQVIISEDANKNYYDGIQTIFSEQSGTELNRINILKNTSTKYIYFVDADDTFSINESELLSELVESTSDAIYVDTFNQNIKRQNVGKDYNIVYVSCWEQIFKVNFIFNKLFPTWCGFSEEMPISVYINENFSFSTSKTNNLKYQYNGSHFYSLDLKNIKQCLLFTKDRFNIESQKVLKRELTKNVIEVFPNEFCGKECNLVKYQQRFIDILKEVNFEENW